MDVIAGGDVARRYPDRLAVAPHRLPALDGAQRELMTRRDRLTHLHGPAGRDEDGPRDEHLPGDRDVVAIAEQHGHSCELDRLPRCPLQVDVHRPGGALPAADI